MRLELEGGTLRPGTESCTEIRLGCLALRKFTAAKGEALGTAYRPCNRRYSGVSSLPRRNVEVSVRSAPSHGTGNRQSYGVSEASEP